MRRMERAAEDLEITATCLTGKARYDGCKGVSERTEFGKTLGAHSGSTTRCLDQGGSDSLLDQLTQQNTRHAKDRPPQP